MIVDAPDVIAEPLEPPIASDLVEYLVMVVPGPDALSAVARELGKVVDAAVVRILDLVVVGVGEDGGTTVIGVDSLGGREVVGSAMPSYQVSLSRHDIELVALALQPGDTAVVIVAEDRWAEPLVAAARALGGELRAGERIARQRVDEALAGVRMRTEEERP
jgi:Family of unknown function (DUF6325)